MKALLAKLKNTLNDQNDFFSGLKRGTVHFCILNSIGDRGEYSFTVFMISCSKFVIFTKAIIFEN